MGPGAVEHDSQGTYRPDVPKSKENHGYVRLNFDFLKKIQPSLEVSSGARDKYSRSKKIIASVMYRAAAFAAVLFALVSLFPRQAVGIFTADGFLTLYTPDGSGELQPDLFVGDSCGLFRLIIGKIRSVSSKVLPAFSSGYDRSSSSVTRFSIKDRKS